MAATSRNAGVPCSAWTLPWAGMLLCFHTLESKWLQLGHALNENHLGLIAALSGSGIN